jgi:uncharacterized membrane protein SpoIIM required for sporulation
MSIGYHYIPLIIAGLGGMAWGLPAAHRLKRPHDIGAAFAVLGGVIVFAFGILLTFIPGFFR